MSELSNYRFVIVIAFLALACVLLRKKGELPLALRGIRRIMRRDGNSQSPAVPVGDVPAWKRFLAFVIVIAAFLIAVI